jgi:aminopeptidase N
VPSRPAASLLRGFSAPVRLEPAPSTEDLERLLAHDDDAFNRWQAAQSLALRAIFARVDALHNGTSAPKATGFVAALKALLTKAEADPAFAALALALPSEIDLAREVGENVDPDILFNARKGLREEIGAALRDDLERLYAAFSDKGAFRPDAAGAGRRALRAATLDLIGAGDAEKGRALALSQFDAASNMTDRLSALGVLALLGGAAREDAFARFYAQFAGDSLVIDKWFALQATIPEEATTQRVLKLMMHHDFSLTNPNRIRALIGAFANANPTCFHALDGSGYDLLTQIVLELDPKNPQIASRLLSSLRSWRTLEPKRRALVEAKLRHILAQPSLSADVKDIATRAIG